jgi:hypothetical protein
VNLVSLANRADSLQSLRSHPMSVEQLAEALQESPQRMVKHSFQCVRVLLFHHGV